MVTIVGEREIHGCTVSCTVPERENPANSRSLFCYFGSWESMPAGTADGIIGLLAVTSLDRLQLASEYCSASEIRGGPPPCMHASGGEGGEISPSDSLAPPSSETKC